VDREDSLELSSELEKTILAKFQDAISTCDVVLLSDYDNGVLSSNLVHQVLSSSKAQKKKVIVDTNGDIYKFKGAYSFTPNQPDTEKALERKINNEEDLIEAGSLLQTKLETEQLLITRGAKGMALFGDKSLDLIPALNLSEVFDVTGAGDTVAALYSVALALGATPLEAAILGNLAASIVVKKYGTATVNQAELLELIERL
jgi:rfaE bifunctional protein kinase chain/domain